SNEDLSGTIKSLIYSYNQLDNKLERHEHRERALGEMMKKAMQSLLKGQKSLEPLNGIFGRLDERVSQIETMLITVSSRMMNMLNMLMCVCDTVLCLQQEEKFNLQTEKFKQDMEQMSQWMRDSSDFLKKASSAKALPASAPAPAPALPNAFVEEQQKINKQLLEELRQLGSSVSKLLDSSQQAAQQSQQGFQRMPKTEELLSQIDAKLQQHRALEVTTAPPPPPKNDKFEQELIQRLGALSSDLAQLRNATEHPPPPPPTPAPAPQPVPGLNEQDKAYIQELSNDTLNALAALKAETLAAQQTGLRQSSEQLQQAEANLLADLKQLSNNVGLLNEFNAQANASQSKLSKGFEVLENFNSMMMTNSELVLDTQRKVEFGTLKIVQQISLLVEQQVAELGSALSRNFTVLNNTVAGTAHDTRRNVTASMDTALEQVWHQIVIMGSELTESKKLLQLMQTIHDGYVNSTFSTMSGLSNKVDATKKHMIDMDTNLNFLLGKLSVMSSEFANIKQGLADSLTDLRNSFQMIHERMPSSSGPHSIEKNQYLTDVNLLSKRHAQPGRE
ncbi:hypothetical protein KR222_007526, partial [Zaprionus bogoriensis]